MSPKYIAFFVFIFIVGTVLGFVIDNAQVGAEEQAKINALTYWQQIETDENWGVTQTIGGTPGYFNAIFQAAIWNFSFLTGPAVYIKWFIWAPLMAMFVWGVILTFISIFSRILS